ncbi:MAG: Asp-tRNA(Asn)/Glu-tRNA(Gln) amidotransferase GatCAB subunit C [Acidimicrobiaceae bacterium]|nr:Asp-tRNA(Asn)/Glu-tRNA(Gln) amidotransferase GatCAB subunit C [Acidimicrobiaceae bacterium]
MNKLTTLGTHFGSYRIESDGDEIVAVHGHELDPHPSDIGQAYLHRSELRVLRPAVRQSWLKDGPGAHPEQRGKEPFVEVEWDRAIDLASDELKRIRSRHGPEALFAGSYGWGSSGRVHAPSALLFRLLRLYGGYTDVWGTYSSSAAEAIVPYFLGMRYHAAIGRGTSWSVISQHTDLFVTFGGLRRSNTEVTYGGQGTHHTQDWMQKARKNGTEFLNIGPIRDDIDLQMNSRWQPIRPGTDVALMLACIHTLLVEDRVDNEFINRYVHGWNRFSAYVMGDSDGQPKSATWASTITGIDAKTIEHLAEEMSTRRTLINVGLSIQRADHGEQSYWAATALACALGQIGLPGGGIAFPFGAQGNVGAGQVRKRVPGIPIPPRPDTQPVISVSRFRELLDHPGQPYDFNGRSGTYPDIKMVWWAGGNPFHHHQNLNELVAAWERPETIVVQEPFWTPTARRADIVLPSSTPLERNDIGGAENMLISHGRAVDPPGDARDDYQILEMVAERLDLQERFTEGRTADEWVELLYELFRAENDWAPDYEEFRDAGYLRHPEMNEMGENEQVFLSEFRSDPAAHPLGTPSGRIELWSETIAVFEYEDCPPHPAWMEPYERLGGPESDRFPLHLVSNQPAVRLHSQYDHTEPSQGSKVAGREPIRIHPEVAKERDISEGEVVRVFNDRGSCLAGAIIDDSLMPEVVQLSTGAWYDPDSTGMCRAGNPNVLTRDKGTSKLAQGPSAHTCLVDIERFPGPAPRVESYDPPQFTNET